jgi:GDSL-like Lipase/Acylhydrolase family
MRLRIVAMAVVVFLTSGSGFAVVGDSVTQDARDELEARGADVFANGGVDIVRGRPAIRQLAQANRRRAVIELGLMDVAFWSTEAQLRRRVRAVMRDDIDGIGCVIWLDLKATSGHPYWPERAGEFNDLLTELAEEYDVHVARWSVFSARHRDWFRSDGIHLNRRGQRGYAKYVDGRVDHFC